MQIKDLLFCAFMVAVMAVLAQMAIPIGPVPFTMAIVGVFLAGGLLGPRLAVIATVVYLLLGGFGVPVFSGGKGGLPVLAGPTGGFLWGYIPAAYLIGRFCSGENMSTRSYFKFTLVAIAGLLSIYGLGVCQLTVVLGIDFVQAVSIGVAPFVVFDLIKIVVTAFIIIPIRRALHEAGLLPTGA